MTSWKQLAGGAALTVLAAAIVQPAMAQVTTSGVRGVVTDPTGAPAAGATVTVTDTRTNASRTATTSASGTFDVRGLTVGGPYNVTVVSTGQQPTRLEGVFLNLGDSADLNLQFSGATTAEVVVVSATVETVGETAIGPAATFSLEDLQRAPAINRDIKDILRIDPRIFVDEAFENAVQCAGANPRFNSLTVDGVRLNDSFGLNSNGFPTERIPFSYDAIEQVAVELAPYDVQYGGFTACNINAVTKSGTNEFHGGLFYDYTDDSLTGDSLEGQSVNVSPFDEKRYGFNIGGPIVKDRLWFFAAYEKLEGVNTFDRGPEGSGAVDEVAGFSQQDFDDIRRIAQDVYLYDPGGVPQSTPNEDEKLLVRLDWNINDRHRANLVYNYNDGFNITESDGDANEFEFNNHLYRRGAELNSYVGSVFSDWTDFFSTEARIGYVKLDNTQASINGTDFGEMQIFDGPNIYYIGADDSRHSNKLNYDVLSIALKGFYQIGDHSLSFGAEREQLDVFNLFVQHSEVEYRFNSIADFEAGRPSRIEYANAPSGDPNDAAASFGYAINTLYAQDAWQVTPYLTLTGGLRYDWYESDDLPDENPGFVADYGFSNALNLDGEGLLQPRFGVSWEPTADLSIRGGVGLYSGGNPNVWLSNNYQATNVGQFTVRGRDYYARSGGRFDLFSPAFDYINIESGAPAGAGPGWGVPSLLVDAVTAGMGGNFEINALDPAFELPSEWKASVGATYFANFLDGEYVLNADLLVTKGQDSAVIKRLDLVDTGVDTVGGLPVYSSPNADAFVLTNGEGTEAINASFSVAREYDFGLDWSAGYAWGRSLEDQPMTSSVAFSNYNNRPYIDPNGSSLGISNYNVEHRFTFTANYEHEFVRDYATTFSLFGQAQSGRPFSFGFDDPNNFYNFTPFLEANGAGSVQFYVPESGQLTVGAETAAGSGVFATNDPLVFVNSAFAGQVDAFNAYLAANELGDDAGGFSTRNGYEGDWWTKFDLKIEQELPGFMPGHRSAGFLIIDNLTNLLNDEWGVLYQPSFPGVSKIVDASVVSPNGTPAFLYEGFTDAATQSRVGSPSLWSVRIGVRYEF